MMHIYEYDTYVSMKSNFSIAMAYNNKIRIEKLFNKNELQQSESCADEQLQLTHIRVTTNSQHEEIDGDDNDDFYNDDVDDKDLIDIYDGVAELLYCLPDSFTRFQNGDSHIQYSKFMLESASSVTSFHK